MSSFFNPPFHLNKDESDGDGKLLALLKDELDFPFLSTECLEKIKELNWLSEEEKNFRYLHDKLLCLFPLILTDALQELKKHDTREFDSTNPDMHTFFDPASLGTTELMEVVKGFTDFEGLLYGASPDRYRDHAAHSFRVWIIGHGILGECFNGELGSLDSVGKIDKKEWMCMWAIVALCHDIGYPLSHIEKINEKARITLKKQGLLHEGDLRFTFSQQMLPFHDTIIKMMASVPLKRKKNEYYTHIQNKYYLKFLKSFDKLDHGIVSALLVSRSLVYFLESDYSHDSRKSLSQEDIRQFYIRREILRAMAAHTCQDIYHLTFNNLSMLLYIIDEIQCWGRPTLEQSQHEAVDVKQGYAEVEQFSEKNIKIKIVTEDNDWDIRQQRGVLIQILKLRQMFRLAVERQKGVDNELFFEVCNQGKNQKGKKLRLEIREKSLRLYHKNFDVTLFEEIPKLKGEIRTCD